MNARAIARDRFLPPLLGFGTLVAAGADRRSADPRSA